MADRPRFFLVAGPNGAGKTTLARGGQGREPETVEPAFFQALARAATSTSQKGTARA